MKWRPSSGVDPRGLCAQWRLWRLEDMRNFLPRSNPFPSGKENREDVYCLNSSLIWFCFVCFAIVSGILLTKTGSSLIKPSSQPSSTSFDLRSRVSRVKGNSVKLPPPRPKPLFISKQVTQRSCHPKCFNVDSLPPLKVLTKKEINYSQTRPPFLGGLNNLISLEPLIPLEVFETQQPPIVGHPDLIKSKIRQQWLNWNLKVLKNKTPSNLRTLCLYMGKAALKKEKIANWKRKRYDKILNLIALCYMEFGYDPVLWQRERQAEEELKISREIADVTLERFIIALDCR